MAAPTTAGRFIRPPTLGLLPKNPRTSGLLISTVLHAFVIAGLIWAPKLFRSPIVVSMVNVSESAPPSQYEPVWMPLLPKLSDPGAGSLKWAAGARGVDSGSGRSAIPQPQKPDYAGPQEIVSVIPNAINSVQTIRRPDLVAPAQLKFPLRLQSMVVLPAPALPVLTAPPTEQQPKKPLTHIAQEVPIAEPTVLEPVLVQPKPDSAPPPEVTPPQPVVAAQPAPSNLTTPVDPPVNALKAVVVVNAVSVPPGAAAVVPDAQLAGNFVVGPSADTTAKEKSLAGAGSSPEDGSSNSGEHSSRPDANSVPGSGSNNGHTTGSAGGKSAGEGMGNGAGTGSGNGAAANTGGPGTGGTGAASIRGPGSGSGTPDRGSGNGGVPGISIAGGIPGRNGASISKTLLLVRSYGLTIIGGGGSGGASRDLGVFGRSETVYSVGIPMADAGGGPDWPMQYALLNPAQASSGLLTPPFAQKKVAATLAKAQLRGGPGPVFITGIIDENGKPQSLRAIRVQDDRSESALRALQQWEFLPAQLDGRPVASKVLIGVTIIAAE
jgi:outer membrane biosynthesis protein TonB